eukprot:6177696-Pleurochrysis_carterae.AAC.4
MTVCCRLLAVTTTQRFLSWPCKRRALRCRLPEMGNNSPRCARAALAPARTKKISASLVISKIRSHV